MYFRVKSKNLIVYLVVLCWYLLHLGCAQIGTVTGGDKDTLAPVIVQANPANFTTSYSKKEMKAYIKFDEFVELRDVNQNLIVSPPLENKPEIKLQGKKVIIDLKNELKPNTTYNLDFGNSIVDLNEGNPLTRFQYVFSTKSYIDSLSVAGIVLNPTTLAKEKDVFVVLYENLQDSTPYKELPLFVSKTDTSGKFELNYIKPGNFKIIAIKDLNSNLKYDPGTEKIAFWDSIIVPKAFPTTRIDSLKTKSKKDSVVVRKIVQFEPRNLQLFLFEEDYKIQYITKTIRDHRARIVLLFNHPLKKDSLIIEPYNFKPLQKWNLIEKSYNRDSLTVWISDSNFYKMDTLSFVMKYLKRDSMCIYKWTNDTIHIKNTEKKKVEVEPKKKLFKKDEDDVVEKKKSDLIINCNVNEGSRISLGSPIYVRLNFPCEKTDISKIQLWQMKDTLPILEKFEFSRDTMLYRAFYLGFKSKENTKYKIRFLPGAFTDILGNTNDTVMLKFSIFSEDDYGNLQIELSNLSTGIQYIVCLLNEGGIEQSRQIITAQSGKNILKFPYLSPGKYKLKLITDNDKNKIWTTGDYLKKRQPEKVTFMKQTIEVKAKWDNEIEWKFEQ